ncbi:hypothetical protein [Pannus brasiliensis]
MQARLQKLVYRVSVPENESLVLPESLLASVGEGEWTITIEPANSPEKLTPVREYQSLLDSYAPSDEGLYDDYTSG